MKIFYKTFFKKRTRDKSYFPIGTVLFVGPQGAGKTLSAVHYLEYLKQKYPDLLIFSNIYLKNATKVLSVDEITEYLLKDFGRQPVAFLLDEIQILLRAKNTKGVRALSEDTLMSISQQRKANKTIIGTLQEFLDLDISYRRQLQAQVQVRHIGNIQIELWRDPNTLQYDAEKNDYIGRVNDIWIYHRHDELFGLYDTYELVRQSIGNTSRQPTPVNTS